MRIGTLSFLATATLLAACGGTANRGIESVHQPVVQRASYAYDFATSGDALAAGERERLAGWMQSIGLGYGDQVAVDDPSGSAYAARESVAAEAARNGLLLTPNAPVTPGEIAPGTLRVVVTRTQASVPGCPDTSRVYQPDFDAHTGSNYGCAVNSNLAAMVARPDDLVRGQSANGSDVATGTKAIDTFRKAPSTSTQGLTRERTGGSSN